jgi:hypothetical protein
VSTVSNARRKSPSHSAPPPAPRQLDRVGKHLIAAHIDREAYRDFKRLGADQLKTTDALVHEALALLFAAHNRPVPPTIARKLEKLGVSKPR